MSTGTMESELTFNFEFNSNMTFSGFTAVTVGDSASNNDVIQVPTQRFGPATGNCNTGKLTGLTAYQPYSCYQNVRGDTAVCGYPRLGDPGQGLWFHNPRLVAGL